MKIENYLKESPLFAISSAYEGVVTKVNQELKKKNLNLLQALILTGLLFEKDEVSPSQLATVFSTSRGNISHSISHLEAIGCVKRVVRSEDARGFVIQLKPEGHKKALGLVKFFDEVQWRFEEAIGILNLKKTLAVLKEFKGISVNSK